jgi:hypothetical protein
MVYDEVQGHSNELEKCERRDHAPFIFDISIT